MKITFNPKISNYSCNYKNQKRQNRADYSGMKNYCALDSLAMLNQINFCASTIPTPVYAMDYWGNYRKFNSVTEARQTLNRGRTISSALTGEKSFLANGYALDYAKNIEKEDENGDLIAQDEKLLALSKKFTKGQYLPLYLIDYSGKIERFDNRKQAKEKFNLSQVYTDWTRKRATGLLFANAYELEVRDKRGKVQFDESGKPKINYEKLHEILDYYAHTNSMPIYLIDKNKNATRYDSPKAASEQTGINLHMIYQCLLGGSNIAGGCVIVNAFDIEKRDDKCQIVLDDNNKPVLDEEMLSKCMKKFALKRQRSLTLYNPNTKKTLCFDSVKDAANAFGVSRKIIAKACESENYIDGYVAKFDEF